MRDFKTRRQIISNLENYNENYLNTNQITFDEYEKNHDILMSLIINEVFLTENQIKSVRNIPQLSSDIIRFRAFITVIQMCSN